MKGLTLTQPWASLVAVRAKEIETRSWKTPYRGPVAIHAAVGFPKWCQNLCGDPRFYAELHELLPPRRLPRGTIVAIAEVRDVLRTEEMLRLWRAHDSVDGVPNWFDDRERHFGDYSAGRYAWRLMNVVALPRPIPCKGALGLWALPADVREALQPFEAALRRR